MNTFMIFATAFICVQIQYLVAASSESSEEEYRVILPGEIRLLGLAGVGVVSQPALQAVKVKVPRYAKPLTKQLLISQALSARGIGSETQKKVLLVRDRRQVSSAVNEVISGPTTTASDRLSSTVTQVPAVGGATKAPVAAGVPVVSKPN
ncbi:PREDICTED: uncharacterized protein LOC108364731 [Rhagoletis zephyria]|uniref:uncharacterized protein LOC108364731 n=1 Tax=Rhagoletis zephyria TaxID=28612 RepID=UPI000811309C|nr:PREDICTED: uncharacterized protein LOC108364731 [Rhagoletis zephyria]